jgi:hypothetical protein
MKPVEGDSIDTLVVHTVATEDGERLTELSVRLRNAHRQYLTVGVAADATVRSALIEGEPVKPSRDAAGKLLLPLVRSQQDGEGLRPITVQLVYQERASPFGAFGRAGLDLPAIELPIASLRWTVDVPERYVVSALKGPVAEQRYAGTAHWQSPSAEEDYRDVVDQPDEESAPLEQTVERPRQRGFGLGAGLRGLLGRPAPQAAPMQAPSGNVGDGSSGGVAVRVLVPHAGHELSYGRYWIDAHDPVWIRVCYLRRAWLRAGEVLSLMAVLAVAVTLVLRAKSKRRRLVAWAVAFASGFVSRLSSLARGLFTAFAERFTMRKTASPAWALVAAGGELALAAGLGTIVAILGIALLMALARLLWLVGHPL